MLNNSLQLGIFGILQELMSGIAKGCAREVSLKLYTEVFLCQTSECVVDGLGATEAH